MPLKEGRNVTAEVWQWKKKTPKQILIFPIIPEQDCQIPFVSLYPCGRPRRETAVLLCNWGLSITGFMHDFSGLHTVSSTCPAVLRPCFCRMHLLWSVYRFLRSVLCWYDRNAVCEMHYDFLHVRVLGVEKKQSRKPACGSHHLGNLILITVRLGLW